MIGDWHKTGPIIPSGVRTAIPKDQWKTPTIEHGVPTRWLWVVLHPENLTLGEGVDIGAFSLIQAQEGVRIGDNVQIGGGVKIYSVSTIDDESGKVVIMDGAKIGANAVIMPGVCIEKNAVVGAGSFVPAWYLLSENQTYVGSPVRRVK